MFVCPATPVSMREEKLAVSLNAALPKVPDLCWKFIEPKILLRAVHRRSVAAEYIGCGACLLTFGGYLIANVHTTPPPYPPPTQFELMLL